MYLKEKVDLINFVLDRMHDCNLLLKLYAIIVKAPVLCVVLFLFLHFMLYVCCLKCACVPCQYLFVTCLPAVTERTIGGTRRASSLLHNPLHYLTCTLISPILSDRSVNAVACIRLDVCVLSLGKAHHIFVFVIFKRTSLYFAMC